MTEPRRVQQKRTKGWRKPENTVSVARPSKFGNPYVVGGTAWWIGMPITTRHEAVAAFRAMVKQNPEYVYMVRHELRGKNLMCFCPLDQPCHADVLLELANAEPTGEERRATFNDLRAIDDVLFTPTEEDVERPYDEATDHQYAAWETEDIEEHAHDMLAVVRHRRATLSAVHPEVTGEDRAEVVTLCGSTKFKDAINAENSRLTQDGHVVISLGLFGHTDLPDYNWDTDATDLKTRLDRLHFQKIRMADRVHVVNVGGYYGESTAREIAYARSLGKPVTFMEEVTS